MQSNQWEIVILKPSKVFLSFLAMHVDQDLLPDYPALLKDKTAYVIQKHEDDEATLAEIESHFVSMFQFEISRWLGEERSRSIEISFLDFLCCFKFELHKHIVLMEPLSTGQQLLRIKPRSVMLKWMLSAVQEEKKSVNLYDEMDQSRFAEDATVVIKHFDDIKLIKPFMKENYKPMFEAEMTRMSTGADQWPTMDSYDTFSRHFAIEVHTQLIHLHH